jgi:hypothetical protein
LRRFARRVEQGLLADKGASKRPARSARNP